MDDPTQKVIDHLRAISARAFELINDFKARRRTDRSVFPRASVNRDRPWPVVCRKSRPYSHAMGTRRRCGSPSPDSLYAWRVLDFRFSCRLSRLHVPYLTGNRSGGPCRGLSVWHRRTKFLGRAGGLHPGLPMDAGKRPQRQSAGHSQLFDGRLLRRQFSLGPPC